MHAWPAELILCNAMLRLPQSGIGLEAARQDAGVREERPDVRQELPTAREALHVRHGLVRRRDVEHGLHPEPRFFISGYSFRYLRL